MFFAWDTSSCIASWSKIVRKTSAKTCQRELWNITRREFAFNTSRRASLHLLSHFCKATYIFGSRDYAFQLWAFIYQWFLRQTSRFSLPFAPRNYWKFVVFVLRNWQQDLSGLGLEHFPGTNEYQIFNSQNSWQKMTAWKYFKFSIYRELKSIPKFLMVIQP